MNNFSFAVYVFDIFNCSFYLVGRGFKVNRPCIKDIHLSHARKNYSVSARTTPTPLYSSYLCSLAAPSSDAAGVESSCVSDLEMEG